MQRHLVRKGRPGGKPSWWWHPSASLRKLGFKLRRLDDDDAIAERQAAAFNAEADAYRAKVATGEVGIAKSGTLGFLIMAYQTHDDFLELAPKTQREYAKCLARILNDLGDAGLKAVSPPVVQTLKRTMKATPHWANACLRVLRILFNFAIREGYFTGTNPATKFRRLKVADRQAYWTHAQQAQFLAVCRPALRLPFLLAVYTAQREGDVLRLPWGAYDGETVTLRQSKTGERLTVPCAAELKAALDAEPRRATIICTDHRGLPWQEDTFRHVVAKDIAAAKLTGVRFGDLRRTAVVRLAEAGCTVPEIASVTGHRIEHCVRIIETYLPRTHALARAAVAKLERR